MKEQETFTNVALHVQPKGLLATGLNRIAVIGRMARRGSRGRFAGRIAAVAASSLLLAFMMLAAPATSSAQFSVGVGISVGFAPPPLPVYTQPICPAVGYIWTPGYWAWDPVDGYYWVPGT